MKHTPFIKYIPPAIFAVALIYASIKIQKVTQQKDSLILRKGVSLPAKVVRAFYAKGNNLEVKYLYKGEVYRGFIMVNSNRYKVNDSVSVMINPKLPGDEVLLTDTSSYLLVKRYNFYNIFIAV